MLTLLLRDGFYNVQSKKKARCIVKNTVFAPLNLKILYEKNFFLVLTVADISLR